MMRGWNQSIYARMYSVSKRLYTITLVCLRWMREREREVDSGYKLSQPGCSLFFYCAGEISLAERGGRGTKKRALRMGTIEQCGQWYAGRWVQLVCVLIVAASVSFVPRTEAFADGELRGSTFTNAAQPVREMVLDGRRSTGANDRPQWATAIAEASASTGGVGRFRDRLCEDCESEAVVIVNYALNSILNGGIVATCSDVCGGLKSEKSHNICMVTCRAIGIAAFVELIKSYSDYIDVTYFCSKAKMCTLREGGSISDASLVVSPATVKKGENANLTIQLTMDVDHDLGAGMIRVSMLKVDGNDIKEIGATDLKDGDGIPAGPLRINILDQLDDQTPAGKYEFQVQVCQCACGSPYPQSAIYTSVTAPLEIK